MHLMPQHQLPGEKQPHTTQERPLTPHPPCITCLWRKMPVLRGYFAEDILLWEQKKERVVTVFSASHCPLHRPLLLSKSCVKGAQADRSGWISFGQVVFPNTHLCLSEKPFRTPCDALSHLKTFVQAIPVTDHPFTHTHTLAHQAIPAFCRNSASYLWSSS